MVTPVITIVKGQWLHLWLQSLFGGSEHICACLLLTPAKLRLSMNMLTVVRWQLCVPPCVSWPWQGAPLQGLMCDQYQGSVWQQCQPGDGQHHRQVETADRGQHSQGEERSGTGTVVRSFIIFILCKIMPNLYKNTNMFLHI